MVQVLHLRHSKSRFFSGSIVFVLIVYFWWATSTWVEIGEIAAPPVPCEPRSSIKDGSQSQGGSALDFTKVATMIEPRNTVTTIPVLINFLSLVPASWPFLIWCSQENMGSLRDAIALQPYLDSGKLALRLLPAPHHHPHALKRAEDLSRFLVGSWFWHQFHPTAEHVLFFQSDSILCSKATGSIEAWLEYDFVGGPVPWASDGRGANGGLSLRRISAMKRITKAFEERVKVAGETATFTWPEDWFAGRFKWDHYFTSEDVFFSDAITKERKINSNTKEIRRNETHELGKWAVDDARDQSDFSLDIWSSSKKSGSSIPIGIHIGNNLGPLVVRMDERSGTFTKASRALIDRCPEILMLRFAIMVTDQEQSRLEMVGHPE